VAGHPAVTAQPIVFLLTAGEAAKALAVSPRTLWSLTQRGDIPCVRIGRSVRYDPADIRAWIDRQKSSGQLTAGTADLT
jgi:excisionase family DNA binding protein